MFKKKLIKILAVISAFILLIFCFILPCSAATTINNINDFLSIVNCHLDIYKSSSSGFVNVTGSQSASEVNQHLYYSIRTTESWGSGNLYRVVMSCDLNASVSGFNSVYYGGFDIVGNVNRYSILLNSYTKVFITHSDGSINYGKLTLSSNKATVHVEFDRPASPVNPVSLGIQFSFNNKVDFVANSTNIDFSLMYLDFTMSSESEISTNAIINNQDKNASDIKANQDKNTNKILNGGHDSPSYSSPDTDIADKFASAEGNVMSDAQSQWDKIDDKFVSVITTVRTSKFYRGMLVVTKILEEFTGITWLGDIILVAFCLGAFSFVIGMSSLIIFRNSDNIKLAQEKSRAQRSFERDMM